MSKSMSRKKAGELDTKMLGWRTAIRDARAKIRELQSSIRVFERNLREGVRWPGDKAA